MAKMPPPPPRTTAEEGSSLDSLSRLYETAKQLDDDVLPPVQRRERAVSDAETFGYKTMTDDFDVRRERSASCGTAPTVARKTTSPSFCETILEEEPAAKGLAEELLDHLAG
jgi:hypothetical protein